MQSYEQRCKAQTIDEAHDSIDVLVLLDHFSNDRMIQGGDAGAECDHQGAHLLSHVDALLEERDQTGQHAGVGETENGERQMCDPERMLDEKRDQNICDHHHGDVQIDHLTGSCFHRDEDVHKTPETIGEIDDRRDVGGG